MREPVTMINSSLEGCSTPASVAAAGSTGADGEGSAACWANAVPGSANRAATQAQADKPCLISENVGTTSLPFDEEGELQSTPLACRSSWGPGAVPDDGELPGREDAA